MVIKNFWAEQILTGCRVDNLKLILVVSKHIFFILKMYNCLYIALFVLILSCDAFSFRSPSSIMSRNKNRNNILEMVDSKKVLLIGGTRFSGLYLWKELLDRGHDVTLYNRGKTEIPRIRGEDDATFENRKSKTNYIAGDRKNPEDIKNKLGSCSFDVIYDMNGRTVEDTAPLADLFNGKIEQFIYMSSAGVYKKTPLMPHREGDEEDENSRHKGKLETEAYLRKIGIPFTSIRPTYIYGPGNYNPLEEYFFTRLDADRTVCIPGHGQHITGLGHVEDLAVAMANIIGRTEVTNGKIYNVQDTQSVTFEGLAKLCGAAMGKHEINIKFYDKKDFDFGKMKAFPMREQHFFCSVDEAMTDLEWAPKYTLADGLKDSYENDFVHKKAANGLNTAFTCDDMVLGDERVRVAMYDGMKADKV